MSPTKANYNTHDTELLAILDSLLQWRHYLEGAEVPFKLFTDHANLKYFLTTKNLLKRQVRWAEKLASYHFTMIYRKGGLNPADGPLRRPDYMAGGQEDPESTNEGIVQRLQAQLDCIEPKNRLSTPELVAVTTRSQLALGMPLEGAKTD